MLNFVLKKIQIKYSETLILELNPVLKIQVTFSMNKTEKLKKTPSFMLSTKSQLPLQ